MKNKKVYKNLIFAVITACLVFLSLSLFSPFKKFSYGILWGDIDSLTFAEKIIFLFFVLCSECIVVYKFYLQNSAYKNISKNALIVLLCMRPLFWNYSTGIVTSDKSAYDVFQADSESLVTAGILSDVYEEDNTLDTYGLCFQENVFHWLYLYRQRDLDYHNYINSGITTDVYENGYSTVDPGVFVLNYKPMAQDLLPNAKTIEFPNGETYAILNYEMVDWCYFVVHTDAGYIFNTEHNGNIVDLKFKDDTGTYLETSKLSAYSSQYGLQGKIFRFIAKHLPFPFSEKTFDTLHIMCTLLLALCMSIICMLIAKKYNVLMSLSFYLVFLFSPWVVNFSKNLYWVEFTWFIPMLIGLYTASNIENKTSRKLSYLAVFCALLVKCLCGYEYVSTILISMMLFLFTDFVLTIEQRDNKKAKLYFKTMVYLGIAAIMGFIAALLLHASLRGEGNLIAGINDIWKQDILRRTSLGNLENYETINPSIIKQLSVSIFEVISMYFNFKTEVIFGIDAGYFIVLAALPIVIFIYDSIIKEKCNLEEIILYLISLMATLSWFILCKAHSYDHTHMNYVLWYFGFVQMCIYIPLNRAIQYIKRGK